jgi:outer membrane immunogenic protein
MRCLAANLIAAFSTAALSQVGLAADLPIKAAVMPPATAVSSWTGFYLGIAGGGGWADSRHTNAINGIHSGTVGIRGGLLGGTYGYNLQLGSWLLGFEGDFSWSGIKGDFLESSGSDFCSAALELHCSTNLRWLGTDRVRFGFAWDRLLFYGTAGVAYGEVEATLLGAPFLVTAGANTRAGFIFGGGVEWAFAPAWSVKAEYLRTDLGEKITYNVITIFPQQVLLTNIDVVRIGLNYHFR